MSYNSPTITPASKPHMQNYGTYIFRKPGLGNNRDYPDYRFIQNQGLSQNFNAINSLHKNPSMDFMIRGQEKKENHFPSQVMVPSYPVHFPQIQNKYSSNHQNIPTNSSKNTIFKPKSNHFQAMYGFNQIPPSINEEQYPMRPHDYGNAYFPPVNTLPLISPKYSQQGGGYSSPQYIQSPKQQQLYTQEQILLSRLPFQPLPINFVQNNPSNFQRQEFANPQTDRGPRSLSHLDGEISNKMNHHPYPKGRQVHFQNQNFSKTPTIVPTKPENSTEISVISDESSIFDDEKITSSKKKTNGKKNKRVILEADDSESENDVQERTKALRKSIPKKTIIDQSNTKNRKWQTSLQAGTKNLYSNIVKRRVKAIGWTMVYSKLLYWSVKNKAIQRKQEAHSNIDDKISWSFMYSVEHITDFAGPEIRNLLSDKKHDYIFVNPKSTNKLAAMGEDFFEHIRRIMDRLINNTKKLTDEFFLFLASVSENGAVLPYDFMSMFELKRLQFTYFGILKSTTAAKSKLILAGIVVLRIFLYKIFMNAKETLYIKEEKNTYEKLLNIGSFLYNCTMDCIQELSPYDGKNQNFLPSDLKIHPRTVPLNARDFFPKKLSFKIDKDTTRESEIIEGFFSKQQMNFFFSENPKWYFKKDKLKLNRVKEIKSLFRGWLDVLYENSHQFYLKKDGKAWKKSGTLTEL